MIEQRCFLCAPDARLVVQEMSSCFAMVGLGPLTSTFCLMGCRTHERSLADLALTDPGAIRELEKFRLQMQSHFGDLLLTEHGRVPICRDDGDDHEQHCFHAHCLLFKCTGSVEEDASTYYSDMNEFTNLQAALKFAASHEQYLLISPSPSRVLVLSEPLNAPRQLVRHLVAIRDGNAHLADWRDAPNYELAIGMANHLKERLKGLE
ncbi:hypothetical protein C8J31_1071 [Rhizobium sp. PP-CC-2G-626]|nr:hypothetical protein C8J31_1071 [Rhizobium sp. PP-CC-2G-626]